MRADDSGNGWWVAACAIVGGLVGGVARVVSNVATGKKWNNGVLGVVAGGATAGAIFAVIGDAVVASYTGAFVESTVNELTSYHAGASKLNGQSNRKKRQIDELKFFLEESLKQKEYILKTEDGKDNQSNVIVYARNNKISWLECFSLIRVDEWTYEVEELIDNELELLVEEYCDGGKQYRKFSMIIVICVNRITPAFQKLVNGNIQQRLNQFRLPVGISFGGKQIYVAKQKDGIAILQYKRLRKEFLDIMGIVEK